MTSNMIPSNTTSAAKKKVKGRTFQCTGYPDCNMTFTRSEHLARHIRKHTGERPFECVHCSRKFSRLDNLRQHKQTVHAHEHNLNGDYQNGSNNSEMKQIDDKQLYNEDHHPNKENTFLQQPSTSSNLPAAATSLLRPTQFRSKHRPRPIALPSRKSVYNDAPYTVPTPRSASSSSQLLLSPISPANSLHQLNYPHSTTTATSSQQHLPSVQFLTSNGSHADSLISPYNSSFSSNISNANTPTNSSFDSSSRTPTNPTFTFTKYPQTHTYNQYYDSNNVNQLHEHHHQQHHQPQTQQTPSSQQPQRRSWLNNVLNSNGAVNNSNNEQKYQTSSSPQYQYNNTNQYQPTFSLPTHQHKSSHIRQPSSEITQHNRVRIENLLNSNPAGNRSSNNGSATTTNNENDRVKLPHVGNLGIDITKN